MNRAQLVYNLNQARTGANVHTVNAAVALLTTYAQHLDTGALARLENVAARALVSGDWHTLAKWLQSVTCTI